MTETATKTETIEVFTPILDRLLVMPIKPDERSQGGIIIPDTAQDAPRRGHVVSTGPGRANEAGGWIPMYVHDGDRILFGKYAGTEIKINGYDYLIIGQNDVLGILTETTVNNSNDTAEVR